MTSMRRSIGGVLTSKNNERMDKRMDERRTKGEGHMRRKKEKRN